MPDGPLAVIAISRIIFVFIALLQAAQVTPRWRPVAMVAVAVTAVIIAIMVVTVTMTTMGTLAIPAIAAVIRQTVIATRDAIHQPAKAVVVIRSAKAARPITEPEAAVIATRPHVAIFHARLAVVVVAIAVPILIIGCASGERGGGEHWKQQFAKHDAIPFGIACDTRAASPCCVESVLNPISCAH